MNIPFAPSTPPRERTARTNLYLLIKRIARMVLVLLPCAIAPTVLSVKLSPDAYGFASLCLGVLALLAVASAHFGLGLCHSDDLPKCALSRQDASALRRTDRELSKLLRHNTEILERLWAIVSRDIRDSRVVDPLTSRWLMARLRSVLTDEIGESLMSYEELQQVKHASDSLDDDARDVPLDLAKTRWLADACVQSGKSLSGSDEGLGGNG